MKITSTYSIKIKQYNHIFKNTVVMYRSAVNFFINLCLNEWNEIAQIEFTNSKQQYVERLCHRTKNRTSVKYDFDSQFYKFPSYLRRSAINEAIGLVSSYLSNLTNWSADPIGKGPSAPVAGYAYPFLYKTDMYKRDSMYTAKIKVFIRNTWDWINVDLNKTDVDYIEHWCKDRKECTPKLQKRGKEWFLDFPFEERVELSDTPVQDQTIVAVDLGINTPATVSVMRSDGTVSGRYFCKLPEEQDRLMHSINRIKKAQQHGNRHTPKLWAAAKGINDRIAVKTAQFIMDVAIRNNADVIVFEHLDRKGRKTGSKKQRLHMWRSQYVQRMVADKAHRTGMHVSHICAWGTSRFAYDGSGRVLRGREAGFSTNELCLFQSQKTYNCDLSASYNIGARYFIRELLKSLPVTARLGVEAKVPQCTRRSTCTLSTLISLNAVLAA